MYVNIVVENINSLRKNTGTLLEASREVGLEVNAEKTKYLIVLSPKSRTKSQSGLSR
jgi:hypothetical protein